MNEVPPHPTHVDEISETTYPLAVRYKASTTQVNLPPSLAGKMVELAKTIITPDDLAEDGFEENLHITLQYGIEYNEPWIIAEALRGFRQEWAGPPSVVDARFQNTSVFPATEYRASDVVKIDVYGNVLERLKRAIQNRTHAVDTFLSYAPHVTLAYVRPGRGEILAAQLRRAAFSGTIVGGCFTVESVEFRNRLGERWSLPIPLRQFEGRCR